MMQDAIVPIDILQRYEDENQVSAVPPNDMIYVFQPNKTPANQISSYSAYPMTIANLVQLYSDFCTWEEYNVLLNKFSILSSLYWNEIRPIMLSGFTTPSELVGVYMCRVQRTDNNFPYEDNHDSSDINKRTVKPSKEAYDAVSATRGSKMMYHGWSDFQTKITNISALAWLAPGYPEKLSNPNSIASDKYLEFRKQFVINLLMNRKRALMTATNNNNLYAQAILASRKIRFSEKEGMPGNYGGPDLKLDNENLLLDIQT